MIVQIERQSFYRPRQLHTRPPYRLARWGSQDFPYPPCGVRDLRSRGDAVISRVSRMAHNPEIGCSNQPLATNSFSSSIMKPEKKIQWLCSDYREYPGTNTDPQPVIGPTLGRRTTDQQCEASKHPSNCTPLSHPDHDQAVGSLISRPQSKKTPHLSPPPY